MSNERAKAEQIIDYLFNNHYNFYHFTLEEGCILAGVPYYNFFARYFRMYGPWIAKSFLSSKKGKLLLYKPLIYVGKTNRNGRILSEYEWM